MFFSMRPVHGMNCLKYNEKSSICVTFLSTNQDVTDIFGRMDFDYHKFDVFALLVNRDRDALRTMRLVNVV